MAGIEQGLKWWSGEEAAGQNPSGGSYGIEIEGERETGCGFIAGVAEGKGLEDGALAVPAPGPGCSVLGLRVQVVAFWRCRIT